MYSLCLGVRFLSRLTQRRRDTKKYSLTPLCSLCPGVRSLSCSHRDAKTERSNPWRLRKISVAARLDIYRELEYIEVNTSLSHAQFPSSVRPTIFCGNPGFVPAFRREMEDASMPRLSSSSLLHFLVVLGLLFPSVAYVAPPPH